MNLATLAAWRVTDTQLALDGEHPEFGTVTLRQLLATWVVHDLGHISQNRPCDGETVPGRNRAVARPLADRGPIE